MAEEKDKNEKIIHKVGLSDCQGEIMFFIKSVDEMDVEDFCDFIFTINGLQKVIYGYADEECTKKIAIPVELIEKNVIYICKV